MAITLRNELYTIMLIFVWLLCSNVVIPFALVAQSVFVRDYGFIIVVSLVPLVVLLYTYVINSYIRPQKRITVNEFALITCLNPVNTAIMLVLFLLSILSEENF